jgi:3-hydroxyisobutyrate dehydrogenase-like beta-hydroxyacid dehydrogenase
MKLGFVGLGRLGSEIASRLLASGLGELNIFDVDPSALERFSRVGAIPAGSATELARRGCDVVGVCVQDDAQLRAVVAGPDGLLAAPMRKGVIAVHSTVHPETCQELQTKAVPAGVELVDAAISNGGRGPTPGDVEPRRLVMVGATPQVFARCRTYLEAIGDHVVHTGPVGSGEVVKLLNNLLLTANIGATAEAVEFGQRLGIRREVLIEALSAGSGSSQGMRIYRAPAERAAHAEVLLRKDVSLALDLLAADGAPVEVLSRSGSAGLAAIAAGAGRHSGMSGPADTHGPRVTR